MSDLGIIRREVFKRKDEQPGITTDELYNHGSRKQMRLHWERLKNPVALDGNSDPVYPPEAERGVDYRCPADDCDGTLRIRSASVDGRVRHFYHLTGGEHSNNIGESAMVVRRTRVMLNHYLRLLYSGSYAAVRIT